jgi:hypothetical protein
VPNTRIVGGAAAGAVAATVWGAQEPIDQRVFGVEYSDTELLAKPLGGYRPAGWALHIVNGALFGAAYAHIAARIPGPGVAKGAAAGMAENVATWPLTRFLPGVDLWGNRRAFWQATWRHLLFGALLGVLEERLARGYPDHTPA